MYACVCLRKVPPSGAGLAINKNKGAEKKGIDRYITMTSWIQSGGTFHKIMFKSGIF